MSSLARIPFFRDATDLDFGDYDRRCAWKRYGEGEIVIDFEDESSDVYFILSGEVRVLIRTAAGKEIILADVAAGDFFGEIAAIDGMARTANVTALTRAELCVMPAAVFREILFRSPACCDRILRLLARRVRELDTRLAEHTVLEIKHRLYGELLRLSAPRAGHPDQRIVSPPPFHHVLAARIGCRREQVTRELSSLAAEGLVEKTRGGLVIARPRVLEDRVARAMRAPD
jgi:CRP/FNR family transcriptional regulator, cyclic AMP receptor protein